MYYAYCRKSTENQQETSFEVQRDFLIHQANLLNEEYTILTETGSGSTMADRPVFMNLLSNLKEGSIVGCYDQSRISRNSQESYIIMDTIKQKGARLQVNGKFINPEDPQDMAIFGIQAVFSDYQRSIQMAKSKEGLKKKKINGDSVFAGDTFGYSLTRHGKITSVSVIEEEAEVIRYVFQSYAKGKPMKELERELWGKVFQRPFQMNIQNIRPMLQRPIYMGMYLDTAGMQKHIQRYTENELREHLIKSNLYPPIVSEELWWEVFGKLRTFRASHAVPYQNRFTKHTLSGIFKCSGCGKGITFKNRRRDGKLFEQYIFQSHDADCPFKNRTQFDAEWLEQMVRACFLLTFLDGARVGLFFKEEKERFNTSSKAIKDEMTLIDKELKKNETKKQRLIDAITDGLIDMNDCKIKLDKLKTEYDSLIQRKKVLQNDLSKLEGDIDDILLMSAQEVLDNFSGREREFYLKYVKSGINYHKYLVLEMMNGTTYEIHKPRRTNVATKPAIVNVLLNGEQYYSFVFSPKMEIEKIYSSNEYMTDTLERWRKLVNGELTQTDTILLRF